MSAASLALRCRAELFSHLVPLTCRGCVYTEPRVPEPQGSCHLAASQTVQKHGSGWRYLCRARVRVRCAGTPGELAVPPAAPASPCFFGAGLPVKIRVAEWREGKTGGFHFILKKPAAV